MNKWTPIEKGLPPVGVPLIVTIKDTFKGVRALRFPVIYRKSFYDDVYGFYVYGVEEEKLTCEYSPVLAWMKFPMIYAGESEICMGKAGKHETD